MLYRFAIELDDWELYSPQEQIELVQRFGEDLVDANVVWLLRANRWKAIPTLYHAGIVFRREPDGSLNLWQSIPRIRRLGSAHCVGLAAWRAAELFVRYGERAALHVEVGVEDRPVIGKQQEFHVMVRRADGSLEDPARALGMP